MEILGIGASPRRGGNSELLLDHCLAAAAAAGASTRKIILDALDFGPCRACDEIAVDGRCRLGDELSGVYRAVDRAAVIVLATPIFFGTVSAQAKMMIDRFQCRWLYRQRHGPRPDRRPGIFLAVAATRREDFYNSARAVARNFFATIDVACAGELFCPGVEGRGAVLEHESCLARARALGIAAAAGSLAETGKEEGDAPAATGPPGR